MVEASAAIHAKGQCSIIVGNPTTTRGSRVSILAGGDYLVYATKDNLNFRHVTEPLAKSLVWTNNRAAITAVQQRTGYPNQWAFGDEAGHAAVLEISADGTSLELVKDLPLLGGKINEVLFSPDGNAIVGLGEGSTAGRANAVVVSNGNQAGAILGHAATMLSAFITPEDPCVVSVGECPEILKHSGPNFKGQGERVANPHDASKFITRATLEPGATAFATVAQDKQIVVYDAKTFTQASCVAKGHNMGIYDALWLNSAMLATASADNTVKVWNVEGAQIGQAPVHTLLQTPTVEKKTQIYRQLVGLYAAHGGAVGAVNLRGDLLSWNALQGDSSVQHEEGHKDLVSAINQFKGSVVYTSQNRIFKAASGEKKRAQDLSAEHKIDQLHVNSHSLYASGFDNVLRRLDEAGEGADTPFEEKKNVKLPGKATQLAGDDATLFVLLHTEEVLVLNAEDLSEKKKSKLSFKPTSMVHSKATGELWIGDKKGPVHVLKADDFSEVHTFTKHSQGITKMAVSADGTLVASGDSYRYTHVHDAASKENISKYAFQPASVMDLAFSEDNNTMVIVATDLSFGVVNLASGKYEHVKNPHGEKKPMNCMVLPDGKIMTNGQDCALRTWDITVE